MKKSFLLISVFMMFLIVVSSGCSVDPDARLNRALERYIEKDPGAIQNLELEFIKYSSIDLLEGDNLQSNGTLLYGLTDNRAEIAYPRSLTLDLPNEGVVTQVAADDTHAVITDGIQLAIFDSSGSHRHDETIGDKKSPVRSLAIDDDSVLYYRNSRLYRYDFAGKVSKQASRETFPSPYTSYYTAQIHKRGEFLGVLAGIAGSYNLNIINAVTGSVVLKGLGLSSSRFFWGEKAVYYIAGNSGKWELMRFDIGTKTKKSLARFIDLVDIEPVAAGYVCETGGGLWTALYGADRKRIPFPYELSGSYKGRALLHYKGVYYFIDMKRLNAGLETVLEHAPGLFTDGK